MSSRLPPHEPALDGDLEPDVDGAVFPEQDEEDEAYFALINTMPTTLAGLAAMIDFMARAFGDNVPYLRSQEATAAFFLVLDESLRRLTGAAS